MTIEKLRTDFKQQLFINTVGDREEFTGELEIADIDKRVVAIIESGGEVDVLPSTIMCVSKVLGVTKSPESVDCYFDTEHRVVVLGQGPVDVMVTLKDADEMTVRTTLRVTGNNLNCLTDVNRAGARKVKNWTRKDL